MPKVKTTYTYKIQSIVKEFSDEFMESTGCSRIYDPISKFYKKQASKNSTKPQIFSERL